MVGGLKPVDSAKLKKRGLRSEFWKRLPFKGHAPRKLATKSQRGLEEAHKQSHNMHGQGSS
jgi:hypothetical protein